MHVAPLNETVLRHLHSIRDEYGYPAAELASVDFAGGEGRDEAWLYDSEGNESLEAWPDHAVLTNGAGDAQQDYVVQVGGIEDLMAYGTKGGTDSAFFHGSDNADKLKSYEDSVRLRAANSSYSLRAKLFDTIESDFGTGGKDIAVFDGSDGNETFHYNGADSSAQMEGTGRYHAALGFDSVTVRFAREHSADSDLFHSRQEAIRFICNELNRKLSAAEREVVVLRKAVRKFDQKCSHSSSISPIKTPSTEPNTQNVPAPQQE